MSITDFIGPLLGVIIGGSITLIANHLSNRQAIKRRILDEQLLAYREISKVIIQTKILFEENLGSIAKAKMLYDEKEISEGEFKKRFNEYFDKLEDSHKEFYKLFYYAHIIDKNVFDNIKLLYESMSRALNPSYILNKQKFDELVSDFNKSLSSISHTIGTNRKGTLITIPNPHVLVHRVFEEDKP